MAPDTLDPRYKSLDRLHFQLARLEAVDAGYDDLLWLTRDGYVAEGPASNVFAVIGGYLGQAMARDDTYQHLRVFEDVVSLVLNNYVEEVDVKKAMRGALNGLTASLDADNGRQVAELLFTLAAEQASTVIVVSHDPALLVRAGTVYRMNAGALTPLDPGSAP